MIGTAWSFWKTNLLLMYLPCTAHSHSRAISAIPNFYMHPLPKQVGLFMALVFPNGSCVFDHHHHVSHHTVKIVHKCFEEQVHSLDWFLNSKLGCNLIDRMQTSSVHSGPVSQLAGLQISAANVFGGHVSMPPKDRSVLASIWRPAHLYYEDIFHIHTKLLLATSTVLWESYP